MVVERHTVDSESVSTSAYSSDGEDSGGAADWSIANGSRLFGTTWTANSASLAIDVRAVDLPPPPFYLGPVEPQVKNTAQPFHGSGEIDATALKHGQAFTTGANEHGYELSSIGVTFFAVEDASTAGDQLVVTLNADDNGVPDRALCTLSDPASFKGGGLVDAFAAPAADPCPKLAPNTTYFVVIERLLVTSDDIVLQHTAADAEDTGRAPGWSIAFELAHFLTADGHWSTGTELSLQIVVNAAEIRRAGAAPLEETLVKNTGQRRAASISISDRCGDKLAQQFTTGATIGGYHLNSIGIHFSFFSPRPSAPT